VLPRGAATCRSLAVQPFSATMVSSRDKDDGPRGTTSLAAGCRSEALTSVPHARRRRAPAPASEAAALLLLVVIVVVSPAGPMRMAFAARITAASACLNVGGSPAIDLADYSTIGCGAANDDSALLSGWVMNNTGCAADVGEAGPHARPLNVP